MGKCIAQVTLNRQSGLPEDVITNTYHFEDDSGFSSDGGIAVNGPGLITRLETFYQTSGVFWGGSLLGTGRIRLYNWDDAKPRVPVLESTFTFVPSTQSLPGEVALVLSYRGSLIAGANAARRRGRVYLGTLNPAVAVVASSTAADPRPTDDTIKGVLSRAKIMARGGAGSYRLAIYSPTTMAAGGSADDAWTDAAVLWCDNSFDTVRSRGAAATKRAIVSLDGAAEPALAAA